MICKKHLNFKYPTRRIKERQKAQKDKRNQAKETEVVEAVKTYL